MAETDAKVMAFVENALKKDPKVGVQELFESAKKMSPPIGKLSRRQFHARYPLQVKRRRAQETEAPRKPGRKPTVRLTPTRRRSSPESQRDAVRQVFLQFATDMVAADDRKELVKVLARVDRYVDQVVRAK